MKKRNLMTVAAFLFGLGGITLAQPQLLPAPARPSPTQAAPGYQPEDYPVPGLNPTHEMKRASVATSNPESLTIDQLIDEVSKIREEKAKLAKKEELFLKTLTSKAAKQKARIDNLLGEPKAAASPEPARIPSIDLPIPDRAITPK